MVRTRLAKSVKPVKRRARRRREPTVAGWREVVFLPDMNLGPVVAKLDTGARSAALHAINIRTYDTEDGQRVRFDAFIDNTKAHVQPCDLPVQARRKVKNTGGVAEERIVVRSRLKMGKLSWLVDITLTDRSDMGVPMLLGRSTIKRRFLVHPSKMYLVTAGDRIRKKKAIPAREGKTS